MPTTARTHFDQDIQRSLDLLLEAKRLEDNGNAAQLPKDIRGSAVALAAGALDAYFCDKYVDCLTKALAAYSSNRWRGVFPAAFRKQSLPAGEVLDARRLSRPKWGIRMAARKIMERDNMYSLSRLEDAFNGILPSGQKVWAGLISDLASLGKKRFTKYNSADLKGKTGKALDAARKKVATTVRKRIAETVQFRHDWIHNCSRPKSAIVNYTHSEATTAIQEIKQFIEIFDDHIEAHRLA